MTKQPASHPVRILRSAIVAIIMIALGAALGFCNEPNDPNAGWATSYESAIQQSEVTGQPIMLFFTGSDWCVWCQRLEAEVMNSNEFENWSKKVIKIKVDFPQQSALPFPVAQQNERLKETYGGMVTSYPTVLFVDAKGAVIAKSGYIQGGATNWIVQTDPLLPTAMKTIVSRPTPVRVKATQTATAKPLANK